MATLAGTFVFGIVVGAAACYIGLAAGGRLDPPAAPAEPAAPIDTAAAPTPPPPPPLPQNSADLAGVWPARHLFIGLPGDAIDAVTSKMLADYRPGGLIVSAENGADLAQMTAFIRAAKAATSNAIGVDALPIAAVAQEGGTYDPLRLGDQPSAAALGKENKPEAVEALGQRVGETALAAGVGVILAPVLDTYKPGESLFDLETRAYASDAFVVAELGLAYARGIRKGGALPVAKSFPGMGTAMETIDGRYVLRERSVQELGRLMGTFGLALDDKIPGMIIGHVSGPEIENLDWKGPAALSPVIVQSSLRERLFYEGVLLADDVSHPNPLGGLSPEEAVVKALAAGCDGVILREADAETLEAVCAAVLDAVAAGVLDAAQLETSKARLDAWVLHLREVAPPEPEPEGEGLEDGASTEGEAPAADLPAEDRTTPETAETPTPVAPAENVVVLETSSATVAPATPVAETPPPAPAPTPAPEAPAPEPKPVRAPEAAAPEATPEPEPKPEPPAKLEPAPQPAGTTRIDHEVARGETLVRIASRYGVSLSDLKAWNALRDANDIKFGAKLRVYVPSELAGQFLPAAE